MNEELFFPQPPPPLTTRNNAIPIKIEVNKIEDMHNYTGKISLRRRTGGDTTLSLKVICKATYYKPIPEFMTRDFRWTDRETTSYIRVDASNVFVH